MSDPSARTFNSDFKRFFLRGLAILLPTVLTLWIVLEAYHFVDNAIAEPINQGVRLGMAKVTPLSELMQDWFDPTEVEVDARLAAAPPAARPTGRDVVRAELRAENIGNWWAARWYMDLIGLAVAIVGVYVAGRLLGGFIGKRIYRHVERFIVSLPVFKQLYPYVKQIVDFLFGEERQVRFSRVVVVQYPREGIWSIGFLTGGGMHAIREQAGDMVSVFIPSSPTPFTGYAITLPRRDVIDMPITVEEAVRFVVSCGVLVPPHQAAELAGGGMAADVDGQRRGLRPAAAAPAEPRERLAAGPADVLEHRRGAG
jgi:uncharacterized membrane protein